MPTPEVPQSNFLGLDLFEKLGVKKTELGALKAQICDRAGIIDPKAPIVETKTVTRRSLAASLGAPVTSNEKKQDPEKMALVNSAIADLESILTTTENVQEMNEESLRQKTNFIGDFFLSCLYQALVTLKKAGLDIPSLFPTIAEGDFFATVERTYVDDRIRHATVELDRPENQAVLIPPIPGNKAGAIKLNLSYNGTGPTFDFAKIGTLLELTNERPDTVADKVALSDFRAAYATHMFNRLFFDNAKADASGRLPSPQILAGPDSYGEGNFPGWISNLRRYGITIAEAIGSEDWHSLFALEDETGAAIDPDFAKGYLELMVRAHTPGYDVGKDDPELSQPPAATGVGQDAWTALKNFCSQRSKLPPKYLKLAKNEAWENMLGGLPKVEAGPIPWEVLVGSSSMRNGLPF